MYADVRLFRSSSHWWLSLQAYRSPTQQGAPCCVGNIGNGFQGYSTAAASQFGHIRAAGLRAAQAEFSPVARGFQPL